MLTMLKMLKLVMKKFNSYLKYPIPNNLNYFWSFGFINLTQLVTLICFVIHYYKYIDFPFEYWIVILFSLFINLFTFKLFMLNHFISFCSAFKDLFKEFFKFLWYLVATIVASFGSLVYCEHATQDPAGPLLFACSVIGVLAYQKYASTKSLDESAGSIGTATKPTANIADLRRAATELNIDVPATSNVQMPAGVPKNKFMALRNAYDSRHEVLDSTLYPAQRALSRALELKEEIPRDTVQNHSPNELKSIVKTFEDFKINSISDDNSELVEAIEELMGDVNPYVNWYAPSGFAKTAGAIENYNISISSRFLLETYGEFASSCGGAVEASAPLLQQIDAIIGASVPNATEHSTLSIFVIAAMYFMLQYANDIARQPYFGLSMNSRSVPTKMYNDAGVNAYLAANLAEALGDETLGSKRAALRLINKVLVGKGLYGTDIAGFSTLSAKGQYYPYLTEIDYVRNGSTSHGLNHTYQRYGHVPGYEGNQSVGAIFWPGSWRYKVANGSVTLAVVPGCEPLVVEDMGATPAEKKRVENGIKYIEAIFASLQADNDLVIAEQNMLRYLRIKKSLPCLAHYAHVDTINYIMEHNCNLLVKLKKK